MPKEITWAPILKVGRGGREEPEEGGGEDISSQEFCSTIRRMAGWSLGKRIFFWWIACTRDRGGSSEVFNRECSRCQVVEFENSEL